MAAPSKVHSRRAARRVRIARNEHGYTSDQGMVTAWKDNKVLSPIQLSTVETWLNKNGKGIPIRKEGCENSLPEFREICTFLEMSEWWFLTEEKKDEDFRNELRRKLRNKKISADEILIFDLSDTSTEGRLVGDLIKFGAKYCGEGEYERTIKLMDAALVLTDQNHSVWNNRGVALKRAGYYEAAIDSFEKALKIKPASPEILSNLGNTHRFLGMLQSDNTGYMEKEYEKADRYLKEAEILEHGDEKFYVNRGNFYREIGRPKEALEYYEKAEASLHYNRGYAYLDMGNLDKAEECFRWALKISPNHYSSYNELGRIATERGELDKAIDFFTKSLEINPKALNPLFNRGNTYRELGKYGEAIVDYTHALELNPWDEQIRTNRGFIYELRGEIDRAEEDYLKARELNPDEAIVPANLASLHFKKEEYEKALTEIEKALALILSLRTKSKIPGRDITIKFSFAAIQLCRGSIEEAVTMYRETMNSDKTTSLHLREAEDELKIVIARFPELKEAREVLEEIERKLGH